MTKSKPSKGITIALFVLSALLVAFWLSACGDPAPTATVPPATMPAGAITVSGTGVAANGQAVFMRYCNTCHPGGGRGAGPALIGDGERKIRISVRNGEKRMPAFGTSVISDGQLNDLVAYVLSLK